MTSASTAASAVEALYLHVPFCERRCEYCDFAAVAGLGGHVEYVDALRAEVRAVAAALPNVRLATVFIGGGTPGLLPCELLAAILDEVRAGFVLQPGCEVTMEANPSSTSEARASAWLAAGVTRVSLGVQSLDAGALRFLGRVHDADRAVEALAELRRAGVPRISADLIYAVPGLGDQAWRATVERVLDTAPGHLSAYELTVEEGTPLHRSVSSGRVSRADEETALRQHRDVVELAAAAGHGQYEVSNFARPGDECRHNLVYWANGYYLACGVGAHGHLPPAAAAALGLPGADAPGAVAIRYWHERSPRAYVTRTAALPVAPVAGIEVVDRATAEAERIMVGLRRTRGVALSAVVDAEARALADGGLLAWDGRVARLTTRGEDVLNAVALRLVTATERRGADPAARLPI